MRIRKHQWITVLALGLAIALLVACGAKETPPPAPPATKAPTPAPAVEATPTVAPTPEPTPTEQTQPKPAEGAPESPPSGESPPSINVEDLIARLCVQSPRDSCTRLLFIDTTQSGWLEFYENLIKTYYDMSVQEYLTLVQETGSLPATGTWVDSSCPGAGEGTTVFACVAEQVGGVENVCYLQLDGDQLVAPCRFPAGVVPPSGAEGLDGSTFSTTYQEDVYTSHAITGRITQADFLALLQDIAQPAPAPAVEPTPSPTPQGTYPLEDFIRSETTVWGYRIDDPNFNPNNYNYAELGLVPQGMDPALYTLIMNQARWMTFSYLHPQYGEGGLWYIQDGPTTIILTIGLDPTPTPTQFGEITVDSLRQLGDVGAPELYDAVQAALKSPNPEAPTEEAEPTSTPPPTPTPGPRFNVEELVGRLCGHECYGDEVCGYVVIIDPNLSGALDFYKGVVQQFYGLSLQDYLALVQGVGELSAHNPDVGDTGLWTKYSCPDASSDVTLFDCLAQQIGDRVCYLEVEGSDLTSSCAAAIAILPARDTPSLDGLSVFKLGKYMPDIYAHSDLRTVAFINNQDGFRGVVQAVAQPPAAAVEPTPSPTPQGTYPLEDFITPRASVWGIEINDPSFDPNAYTYENILYALQQEGLVPQWMDLDTYQAIMDAGGFVTFGHLHPEYGDNGLYYIQEGAITRIIAIGNASEVYPTDPTATPHQMNVHLGLPVKTTFIRALGEGGTESLYAVTQGIMEDIPD